MSNGQDIHPDFIKISEHMTSTGMNIIAEYSHLSKDAVSRGGQLYGYWDGERWNSLLEGDTKLRMTINDKLYKYMEDKYKGQPGVRFTSPLLNSGSRDYRDFIKSYSGNPNIEFDTTIFYKSDTPARDMYSTYQLPYDPQDIPTPTFDKMMDKWYEKDSQERILWLLGASLSNNMKNLEKFLFIYGKGGAGKGSLIKVIEQVYGKYIHKIDVAKLASKDSFATSQVRNVPVFVDDDADLSRVENQPTFLKMTAHEKVEINKKNKEQYYAKFEGLLIIASNKPFDMGKAADANLERRVVTAYTTGETFPPEEYFKLMEKVKTEVPGIAYKAIQTYNTLGINYIKMLRPDARMRVMSDDTYDFLRQNVASGVITDPITYKKLGDIYKDYLEDMGWSTTGYKKRIKQEALNYFKNFDEQTKTGGPKNVFSDLDLERLFPERYDSKGEKHVISQEDEENPFGSTFNFFAENKSQPAQYSVEKESGQYGPERKWDNNFLKAADIDQSKEHWLVLPDKVIRLDFDADTMQENARLLSEYPATYAEISRSGKGIHAYYIYDGDVFELETRIKGKPIEVKLSYKPNGGDRPARRKFTYSNGYKEFAHLVPGQLPQKEKAMLKDSEEYIYTERSLRNQIEAALNKEHHGATAPEVSFIKKVLDDAAKQGLVFDLSDMKNDVAFFASSSSHQAQKSLQLVSEMVFSTVPEVDYDTILAKRKNFYLANPEDIIFYDLEVFQNMWMISYKTKGKDDLTTVYNPSVELIQDIFTHPTVGFNNLNYDNQIVYYALQGASVRDLFQISQDIIVNKTHKHNYAADQLSYADIYDFASAGHKKSLKKWEIELGLKHDELEHDFNEPLPENAWERAGEYNRNDVIASEKVFDHLRGDYIARVILAQINDMPVMTTTNNLTKNMLFGEDGQGKYDKVNNKRYFESARHLNWHDLSEDFPGYTFDKYAPQAEKSHYKGFAVGEGGFVYANPGVYTDTVEIDMDHMHPSSMIALNYYGPYDPIFREMVWIQDILKVAPEDMTEEDRDRINNAFGGVLKPFLEDPTISHKDLRVAFKTANNSTYGLTSASFDNAFKDPRNVDNIVAKRGALFMIDLLTAVQEKGWTVVHIKTDSIKIANATDEKIKFVQDFAEGYGYHGKIEAIYDRMALVNNAVLIAHYKDGDELAWHAIGKQFAEPYVYKTLFTGEDLELSDYWQTKQTKNPMYLVERDANGAVDEATIQHIGKAGSFYASYSGRELVRKNDKTGKYDAVVGTKGWKFTPSEEFVTEKDIDMAYYDKLQSDAIQSIELVGDISVLLPGLKKG